MIEQLLPQIQKCDGSDMWQAIELKQSLFDLQNCSLYASSGPVDHHIAIHVRRGDYKFFNHDIHISNPAVPIDRQCEIQEVWSEADAAVEVIRKIFTLKQKTIIWNFVFTNEVQTKKKKRKTMKWKESNQSEQRFISNFKVWNTKDIWKLLPDPYYATTGPH